MSGEMLTAAPCTAGSGPNKALMFISTDRSAGSHQANTKTFPAAHPGATSPQNWSPLTALKPVTVRHRAHCHARPCKSSQQTKL